MTPSTTAWFQRTKMPIISVKCQGSWVVRVNLTPYKVIRGSKQVKSRAKVIKSKWQIENPKPSQLLLKKELEKFKLICLLPSALELHASAINLLEINLHCGQRRHPKIGFV